MALVAVRCPTCHAPVDAPARPVEKRIVHAVFMERVGPSNRARARDVLTKIAGLASADAERVVTDAPCDAVVVELGEHAEELAFALREAGVGARVEEREIVSERSRAPAPQRSSPR